MEIIEIDNFVKTKLGNIDAFIFPIKVKEVLPIYYVAVRGRDAEEGAVQRVLNKGRINAIKKFILEGNMFYNNFIFNWVNDKDQIECINDKLRIPKVPISAQVIDGQHRLEGIKQAYEEDHEIGEKTIIVVLTQHLSTSDAANIFLNINTEQKPVPKSLVYDLFGEVRDKDYYIVRAKEIAQKMHEDQDAPYYQCIKLPGASRGVGKVDLSTFVNAIKQYVAEGDIFSRYHLDDFEPQYLTICNFFGAIKSYYDKEGIWLTSYNPFMSNSGCYAAIDFLCKELISKCAEKSSFEQKTIKQLLPLDEVGLLYSDDLKNKQGKEQRKIVYQYLESALLKDVPAQNEYKF